MSDVAVIHGDMRDVLGKMIAEGKVVQSVVTDPPYHLGPQRTQELGHPSWNGNTKEARAAAKTGFMGKKWDGGDIAFQPGTWRLCFELLPPGGHLLAFSGTRTYHRMAVAIEEAGFEMRDTIAWLYGSGFPKSLNVSKAIDRAAGVERDITGRGTKGMRVASTWDTGNNTGVFRAGADGYDECNEPATEAARQWDGWGTALKPAMELICVARKPLVGTVAANVLAHGTGALNINECRVATDDNLNGGAYAATTTVDGKSGSMSGPLRNATGEYKQPLGRWPANVVTDGSDEVVKAFPGEAGGSSDGGQATLRKIGTSTPIGGNRSQVFHSDNGSAARFFYSAKADADDRLGSKHPTIKPVDLMRWLVRLITPPGGTVLDPFAGSGATGMACMAEGIDCILIEREDEYIKDIRDRIAHVHGEDTPLFSGVML